MSGTVQRINFKNGSAEILPASLTTVDGAAKAFAEFPTLKVEIQGHTDDVTPAKQVRSPTTSRFRSHARTR